MELVQICKFLEIIVVYLLCMSYTTYSRNYSTKNSKFNDALFGRNEKTANGKLMTRMNKYELIMMTFQHN